MVSASESNVNDAASPGSSSASANSSTNDPKRSFHSSNERDSRWKARLKFDVDTSSDEGSSKKQANGNAKCSSQTIDEINDSDRSARSSANDSKRSTSSSKVHSEEQGSDRRELLSPAASESDLVNGNEFDGEDVAPSTSKPERREKPSRSKQESDSEECDEPRKYRQKRSHSSSSRGKRSEDDVSPRRRRSPGRKRQRRSRSRRSRSRSEHHHWSSHNAQKSRSKHRSDKSREEKYHRGAHRNERSPIGGANRALEDRKGKYDGAERRRRSITRSKSRSPAVRGTKHKARDNFTRKRLNSEEDEERDQQNKLSQTAREDAIWAERREERERRGARGVRSIWGASPSMHEIHSIYQEYERMEEEQQERARKEEEKCGQKVAGKAAKKEKSKKEKDKKKSKKHKKKKKKKKSNSSDSSEEEEWVEVTKEMREAEAAKEKLEEASMVGPAVPEHLLQKQAALIDHTKHVNYGKDMLRGEAAAMAAYIAQGKRIPRRGEIGLSSAEISEFEKIGYVMSGTRHKSMEATRLRKENQVMTAEEKRLLSGFTHDERKKKEEIVLQQFRSFIESKKAKN
ncbi:UPF0396 protein [Toxocara canis]|uniref:UPF0396 protein n=1 Tax=Toxocara canis TaxID=6265 RepID=A0A0B2W3W4_TOXCA|nr:UPF0396 protein [Toxocara canis]